jgi:nucleoside-diphosphate-sugar epimerase
MTIVVTGANGFVGSHLCRALQSQGMAYRAVVRKGAQASLGAAGLVRLPSLDAQTDWTTALQGATTVIHLAARVHQVQDSSTDPLQAFRATNLHATLQLAQCALKMGVQRFIFVSTVKVLGEETAPDQPFRASDLAVPQDAYATSKHEAEQALRALVAGGSMELVIVRPPLVYGPGVRANFASLMRVVRRGIPLPLARVHNLRSLVGIDNLVSLLLRCTQHADAGGQIFLVSDGHDLSTPDLVRQLATALGRPARLWPVPLAGLQLAARLTGRQAAVQRLCSSLQVDISATCQRLQWAPPVPVAEGMRRMVVDMDGTP